LYHITIQLNSDAKIANTIVEQNGIGRKKAWIGGQGGRKMETGEGKSNQVMSREKNLKMG
jgi:hypothetical protein